MHPRRWFARIPKTWSRRLVLAAVAIVVLAVAAVIVRGWWQSRQAEAELARIRAAGEPVTIDDLSNLYNALPADDEATHLWLNAIAAQKPYNKKLGWDLPIIGTGRDFPAPGKAWPQLEDVEKYLAYQGEFLRLLHAAAEHEGRPHLPVRFDAAFVASDMYAYVIPLRSAPQLLALEAHARAHRGDGDGAADAIRASLACGRAIEPIPSSLGFMVMTAMDPIALGEVEALLPCTKFSDAQLARLQVALRQRDYKDALRRALLGDRVGGIADLEGFGWYQTSGSGTITLRGELASYLRRARASLEKVKQPWDRALHGVDSQWLSSVPPRQFFGLEVEVESESLDTHWGMALVVAAAQTARFELADAAIAAKRYQMRHGRWPDGLEQLVPEFLPQVPHDPFDGKPLRCVCDGGRCVVYSIGSDGVDGGGVGGLFNSGAADIVFRIRTGNGSDAPD